MSTARDAVVLAGGRGSRLRPLTDDVPKPLLPLAGTPFLHGLLARLAEAGVSRVHLMVGSDPAPFAGLRPLADAMDLHLVVHPEPAPLDTAGGMRRLVDGLTGPVLVCNGDILTDLDLGHLVARHTASGARATLALTRVSDPSSFGICLLDGERVVGFVEKPDPGTLVGHDTVNAGTYVLEPAALEGFGDGPLSFERDVFPELVASGAQVTGVVDPAAWADLGTPTRLLAGQRLVLDGRLAWPPVTAVADRGSGVRLESGVSIDPSARLVGPLLLRRGTAVGPGAVVGPFVATAPEVVIGPHAVVSDTALGAGTQLGAHARVSSTISAEQVSIGPRARLDGPVTLARGVTVAADEQLDPGSRRPAL